MLISNILTLWGLPRLLPLPVTHFFFAQTELALLYFFKVQCLKNTLQTFYNSSHLLM